MYPCLVLFCLPVSIFLVNSLYTHTFCNCCSTDLNLFLIFVQYPFHSLKFFPAPGCICHGIRAYLNMLIPPIQGSVFLPRH